jgi:C4-dicarboxylate-specific signal transduction histidine kinase
MNAPAPLDDKTMKLGLLLETAQTQQRLIGLSLRQLKAHTQELDDIVREQIRRTLAEEFGALVEEAARALQVLRDLKRSARLQIASWTMLATIIVSAIAVLCVWWLIPSQAQISALRLKQQQLSTAIDTLQQLGGRIDLRRCGDTERWCVRVERQAPAYGEQSDYYVVKGY